MSSPVRVLLLAFLATGCGAPPPAKAPEASATTTESTGKAETAKPKQAEQATSPEVTRLASDRLLEAEQMYSLAFSSSEPGKKAEESCSKHADNPKKRNQCMRTARAKIKKDVLHFVRDDSGNLFWITSQQNGNKLKRLKKVGFKIVKETENSVEIKVKGRAQSVTIGLPDEYSIEVPDATYGKLVYNVRVNLAGDE